ncbi:MAG: hypothetical protein ACLFWL_12670 [Candidatus Brocadiia bacterium]
MSVEIGSTFRDPTRKVETHLFVIISKVTDDEKVVVTNFTSFVGAEWQDDTCIILPEEYKQLSRSSCISYSDSNLVSFANLEHAVESGGIALSDCVPENVLNKILAGAAESEYLENNLKNILDEQGLLPEEPAL